MEDGLLPAGAVFVAVDEVRMVKRLVRHRRWFGETQGTLEDVKTREPLHGVHTFLLVPLDTPPNGV